MLYIQRFIKTCLTTIIDWSDYNQLKRVRNVELFRW